jgi:hypothetical protein
MFTKPSTPSNVPGLHTGHVCNDRRIGDDGRHDCASAIRTSELASVRTKTTSASSTRPWETRTCLPTMLSFQSSCMCLANAAAPARVVGRVSESSDIARSVRALRPLERLIHRACARVLLSSGSRFLSKKSQYARSARRCFSIFAKIGSTARFARDGMAVLHLLCVNAPRGAECRDRF